MKKEIIAIFCFINILILSDQLAVAQNIQAQQIKRIRRGEDYIEAMSRYFATVNDKEADLVLKNFDVALKSGVLTDEQKENITKITNDMLDKKARPTPHFTGYMSCILNLVNNGYDPVQYAEWEKSYTYLLDKSSNISKLMPFVDFINTLLTTNTLFKSGSTHWVFNNRNFKIVFDKEIKVDFTDNTLTCFALGDSIQILDTRGTYYPIKEEWIGTGGKVTWERAGFLPDEVYATLNNYKIDMTKYRYEADSVIFTHKSYLTEPLIGKFEDRVKPLLGKQEEATFPQFSSHTKRQLIPNILPDMDYIGGFTLEGIRMIGSGTDAEKAYLIVKRDGVPFLTATSQSFVFRKEKDITRNKKGEIESEILKEQIKSVNASFTIKLGTDSIYHPSVTLQFLEEKDSNGEIKTKQFSMIRVGSDVGENLFRNTYHKYDIDAEMIIWDKDSSKIVIRMLPGSRRNEASFKSDNFFDRDLDARMQGVDDVHPIISMKLFLQKHTGKKYEEGFFKGEEFQDADFAAYRKFSLAQIQILLLKLSNMGLINYDPKSGEVVVTERFGRYLEARAGRIDHDGISIPSNTGRDSINAEIDLQTFDMKAFGVKGFRVSDVQNLWIEPANKVITIKKDHNIQFNGNLFAGLVKFTGNEFFFNYNDFKVDLNKTDSIQVWVKTDDKDDAGRPLVKKVQSTIETKADGKGYFTGIVSIDNPNNKSGVNKDKYPQYPIFDCKDSSYVFYDKRGIKYYDGKDTVGVYPRDDFYFQIYPYVLQQLDSIKSSLFLHGSFYSGGIMPVIQDSLEVMRDISFGFDKTTEDEGIEVYGGKGKIFNHIELSNAGLRSDGKIEFLTSKTFSYDFLFFPDSMNTDAYRFTIDKKQGVPEYPSVKADSVYIHWEPANENLTASKKKVALTMYDNETKLHGSITITPKGTSGKGKVNFTLATLDSKKYEFRADEFETDSAGLAMRGASTSEIVLQTDRKIVVPPKPIDETFNIFENQADTTQNVTTPVEAQADSSQTVVTANPIDSIAVDSSLTDPPKKKKKKKKRDEEITTQLPANDLTAANDTTISGNNAVADNSSTKKKKKKRGDTETVTDTTVANANQPKIEQSQVDNQQNITASGSDNQNKKKKKRGEDEPADSTKKEVVVAKDDHVKALVNFTHNEAIFRPNPNTYIRFPLNKYVCFLDQFAWYMTDNRVEITTDERGSQTLDLNLEVDMEESRAGARYISEHPDQDSLRFISTAATYNLTSHFIQAHQVNFIRVADAAIYPSTDVIVRENAKMEPLTGANVVSNMLTKFHAIYNSNVKINGREDYFADGDYNYHSEGGTTQIIHFNMVKVVRGLDSTLQTYAEGKIDTAAKFMLSPYFSFIGEVELRAPDQYLTFVGKTQILHACNDIDKKLFRFSTSINPDSIYIPVDPAVFIGKPVRRDNLVYGGMYLTSDSAHVYPAFISKLKNYSDNEAFSAIDTTILSYLYFDKTSMKYKLSNKYKIMNDKLPGNYLALDTKTCNVHGDGKMTLGVDFGRVTIMPVGNIDYNSTQKSVNLELVMGVDFIFPDKATEILARSIEALSDSAVDLWRPVYIQTLSELLDTIGSTANADKLIADLSLTAGQFDKIPAPLRHTITFTDLNMKWYSETNAYRSVGKIGVGSIGDIQLNRYVTGTVEILHRKTGDVLSILFDVDDFTWFYFTYDRGALSSLSSSQEYNDVIESIKEKDRKIAAEDKKPAYLYELSNDENIQRFRRRISSSSSNPDDEQ